MKRNKMLKPYAAALLFLLAAAATVNAATSSVDILSLTPPDPGPGDLVAVEFSYCADANETTYMILAVSQYSTIQPNNTVGQTFKVNENGIDVGGSGEGDSEANGGYNMGDSQGSFHCQTLTWNIHVPDTYTEGGTYYFVLAGRAYYCDPSSIESQDSMSFSIPLPPAGAGITKTAENDEVRPGDHVLYTIDYDFVNATNFIITDTVPQYCTLISQSQGGTSSGTSAGSSLTWALGDTTAREKGEVWFEVQVNASAPASTAISNTAQWVLDEVPSGGDSNTVTINTYAPFSFLKSQSVATADIGDTVTYSLDFNAGGLEFISYDTFDSDISGFFSTGGTWSWVSDGEGGGYIYSPIQSDYPHYLRNTPDDFCFGEIRGDVYISDNDDRDALITFRDNGLAGASGRAYGFGISADGIPSNVYLQEVNPTYQNVAGANPFTVGPNTWYTLKILVTDAGNGEVRIRGKAWLKGDDEPSVWHIDWTDTDGSAPVCGYVGFQGHPTNYNYYDNLKILKAKEASPVIFDTIPSELTFIEGTAADAAHSGPVTTTSMVSWDVFTSFTNTDYHLEWSAVIDSCGLVYNTASFDTYGDSPQIDSNTVTLNVICPGTPTYTYTITPTFTATPTYTFTSTGTPTFTPTFTGTPTMTASPTMTITPTPVLPVFEISKSVSPNPAKPGETVAYVIQYRNTGGADATGVVIWDTLSGNLEYAGGADSYTDPLLVWNIPGTVPAGSAWQSVSCTAVVVDSVTDGQVISNTVLTGCFETSSVFLSNVANLEINVPELELIPVTNYPNPAAEDTTIVFGLTVAADVAIKFYTISGEPVRTMTGIIGQEGTNEVFFDTLNDYGKRLSSGVYFYRITARRGEEEDSEICKLAIMR